MLRGRAMTNLQELAYALWEARGRPSGDDWVDWFAAEARHRGPPAAAGNPHTEEPGRSSSTESDPADPTPRRKRGVLKIEHGQPLRFKESRGGDGDDQVGDDMTALILTFRAYRKAAKELLSTRYAPVQQLAPAHLREPCNVTILKSTDGMLVRHDVPDAGEPKVRAATVRMTLQEAAPMFSEGLLHFPADPSRYTPAMDGPTMILSKFDPSGATETVADLAGLVAARSITTTEKAVTYTLFEPAAEACVLARQAGCPHAQSFFVWVARVLCCLQWSEQCPSVRLDGTSQ